MTNDITEELFDRHAYNEHSYPYLIHPLVFSTFCCEFNRIPVFADGGD
jgi:hypothetical protein